MVALFLRPDADISDGGWTDEGGATTLFDAVDESSFSDTDYIRSTVAAGDKVSLRLSDPGATVDEPFTVRYRCKREGGDAANLIIRLYEATSPPTLIMEFDHGSITDAFATYTHNLTATEFAAIGDFNNLYLEFEANPTSTHNGAIIDLNFVTGDYFEDSNPGAVVTDFLSCSRASIGYAKTATGTLTQFASNVLRNTNLGLLVEDARENICLYSNDPSNTAQWSNYLCTLTSGISDLMGGTNAYKMVDNATNDTHQILQSRIVPDASTVTISVYLKQFSTDRHALINHADQTGNNGWSFLINLSTWAVTPSELGSVGAESHSIEEMADGWHRFTATVTFLTGSTGARIQVYLTNASFATAYAGDGVSGIYLFGPQIEIASFPSSYIPTTTTSATRAADVVTNIGTLSTDIAAATGSIIAQIDGGKVSSVAVNIVDSNGTNLLGFDATNHGLTSISATLATSNTANRTTQDKLGLAWNASGRSLVLNGGTVATDATAQTPNSTQHLGSSGSANFAYAYVERLSVWTSKLADATLQTLTTP